MGQLAPLRRGVLLTDTALIREHVFVEAVTVMVGLSVQVESKSTHSLEPPGSNP